MYISAQSIAAAAMFGLGVLPASAVPNEENSVAERSLFGNWFNTPQNLCDKPNYGAVGKPWDHSSKPGAWCGGKKPSYSGQWAQLVSSATVGAERQATDHPACLGWRRLCQVQVDLFPIRLEYLLWWEQVYQSPMGMQAPQVGQPTGL
jgi:hypothetical protein